MENWVLFCFLGLLFISVLSYYLGGGRLLAAFQKEFPDVKKTLDEWNSLLPKTQGRYFTHRQAIAWRAKWNSLLSAAARLPDKIASAPEPDASTKVIQQIMTLALILGSEAARSKANKAWVQSQLKKHSKWFDSVEKFPLSEEQRISAVTDEDRNLIVAGAGTGKTSAIVGKVGYLVEEGISIESDLLLLAYNKKAANELQERIREKCQLEVEARTFHSFGLSILGAATGSKPSLSKLAGNEDDLRIFIQNALNKIASGPESWQLSHFIALLLTPYYTIKDFDGNQKRFLRYKRALKNRTLKGEKVKSLEEMRIANWLYLNGVKYQYEREYPVATATPRFSQYKPDFYLPQYDIYIEHYGLDKDGHTAVGIDEKKYRERMKWHEGIHHKYKTRLVKTYSADHADGSWRWSRKLKKKLKEQKVDFNETSIPTLDATLRNELSKHEISMGEESIASLLNTLRERLSKHGLIKDDTNSLIFDSTVRDELLKHNVNLPPGSIDSLSLSWVKEIQAISQLSNLMMRFLNLYKSKFGGDTAGLETIREDDKRDLGARDHAFLDLFKMVLEEYQAELSSEGTIDFDDMIHEAADGIRKELVKPNYQYVIVDEFQDISQSRADLLLAVLEANPEARLFAVGDDWQSIYRFTGSDLTLMTDFENTFGKYDRMDLSRAFRFSQESLDVSSIFIQQNPSQLKKALSSEKVADHPTVTIIDDSLDSFRKAARKLSPAPEEILLLSRYRFSELSWFSQLKGNKSRLTVHKSKGLEADCIILIDLEANTYGFPSQIEDDPVLDLLFPPDENYPFGEERRLFYVALTRAKRNTFIVAPSNIPPSEFLDELREMAYEKPNLIKDLSRLGQAVKCPLCKEGSLVKRKDPRDRVFFSCEFFPVCEGKGALCPKCQKHPLYRENEEWLCAGCDHKRKLCPSRECEGYLLERINSKTEETFIGCSEFPYCRYTKPHW